MKDRKVKTRKEHECAVCSEVIQKGENATFGSIRIARYNNEDEQIGIHYAKFYICKKCQQ